MIAAALVALTLAAAPGCARPALESGERPWKTGESLGYDLDVLGMVKTGTLQLAVERPISAGKVIPLRARARTTAQIASIRSFAGVALSWIDASTLLPERYRDEAEEGGVRKVSDARIRPPAPQLVIEFRFGDKAGKNVYPRSGDVLDGLSTLYYLRAAHLDPGAPFCFELVANRRFWRVEGSVAGKTERVDTPAGRFDTLRVDALARKVDRPDDKPRPLHIWFSTDRRRLPVAIVSEIDVGPVSATLSSVRGAR